MEEPPSSVPTSSLTSTASPPASGASSPSTSDPSLTTPPGDSYPDEPTYSSNHPYAHKPRGHAKGLSSTSSINGFDYDPSESISGLPNSSGFYGVGNNDTMESVVREGLEDWTRRATVEGASSLQASYSAGPTVSAFDADQHAFADRRRNHPYASSQPPGDQFLHPPNTLSILWSFAHLEGTFEVEDALIRPSEFVEVKKTLLGGKGTGVGMGGGTLEDTGTKSGWKSWLFGADQAKGAGATLEDRKNYTMKEKTVPTFSSPPSILGIDLVLEPGQSKSCDFLSVAPRPEFPSSSPCDATQTRSAFVSRPTCHHRSAARRSSSPTIS